MSEARVGAGNIAVQLNGEEYNLVPTLEAAQSISRGSGGLRVAINSVMNMDIDTIVRVVQLGLGPAVVKELGGASKLPQLVWESGFTDTSGELAVKCIEYLTVLSNAGRPVGPKKDDGGDPPR